MEKKLKILPPMMPNFFFYEQPVGQRQDGIKQNSQPITDLTQEEAQEFAKMMHDQFLKHWKDKKATLKSR